jgi:hypothetical protein
MPWVLVAAAGMVLLIYVVALAVVVTFLYRHLIEASVEWLVTRLR